MAYIHLLHSLYSVLPQTFCPVTSQLSSAIKSLSLLRGVKFVMANEVHNTETLLSSQVLNHHDSLSENKKYTNIHCSSPESNLNGFWSWDSSSSSGLSTPLGSELGSTTETSTESDDDEDSFMVELTRQMADYMLEEDEHDQDDDENGSTKFVSDNSKWSKADSISPSRNKHVHRLKNTSVKLTSVPGNVQKRHNIYFHSKQTFANDQIQPVECYQLQNQPVVNQKGSMGWGRGTKSGQKVQHKEHINQLLHGGGRASGFSYGGRRVRPLDPLHAGSGMRAIFLGGSGSGSRTCGTGVFLPCGTNGTTEPRRKSGCSTVLIPARVLQTLEPHFNSMNMNAAQSQSKNCSACINHPAQHDDAAKGRCEMDSERKQQSQFRTLPELNSQELQLPSEWTY